VAEWFYPTPDTESESHWNGMREGKLLIKHCKACDKVFFYPRRFCPRCWSEQTEWIESARTGRIYSYSIVRQNPVQPFAGMCPYAVVIVDLDEGPRMMANWELDASFEALKCGAAVEIIFRKVSDELSLPVVRLRG
jgi:uncharacterized protein